MGQAFRDAENEVNQNGLMRQIFEAEQQREKREDFMAKESRLAELEKAAAATRPKTPIPYPY